MIQKTQANSMLLLLSIKVNNSERDEKPFFFKEKKIQQNRSKYPVPRLITSEELIYVFAFDFWNR